jgi:hypothetical protein
MDPLNETKLRVLDQALSLAWDRFLRTGLLNEHNVSDAKERIAKGIFNLAGRGEWDPRRLARDAVRNFCETNFSVSPPLKVARRRLRSAARK